MEKNNCLIHNIPLVTICLLLVVVSAGYNYYYAKSWIKKENVVSQSNIKCII